MKILFVISTLRSGGAERVCSLIASQFAKFHDVSLAKFDSSMPFYELSERIKLINLNQGADDLGILRNFKKRLNKLLALRSLIKNGGFDAVISFLDSTNALVIVSSLGLKTPIIVSEHTSFDAPKRAIFKILRHMLYPFADAISVLTRYDAAHYAKFCKNVRVIHNPFFADKAQNLESKKQNLVIFVGRLMRLKNCEMFVRVAASLKDSGYEFAVAGEGEQRSDLEKLSAQLGANVKFLSNVADIGTLYQRAKILLSCSTYEGLGNTLIEAINFDCARVATKTSGAAELITDGFDGLLCEINDVQAMSAAVRSLVDDEERRAQICKNARARLDEFSLQNIYEQWLGLLKLGGASDKERE